MKKSYFIARDRDNTLWMYNYKPKRQEDYWIYTNDSDSNVQELDCEDIGINLFEDLTYEDDPLELVLKEDDVQVNGKSYFIATDDDGEQYIFDNKPIRDDDRRAWWVDSDGQHCQHFNQDDLFDYLTFKDDAVELVLVGDCNRDNNLEKSSTDCFDKVFNVEL